MISLWQPLLQVVALLYGFVLPGVLIAWHVAADWSRPVRLAVGVFVGLLVTPMLSFVLAWWLATSITPLVVIGAATLVNAAAGGALFYRKRNGRATVASSPTV